MTLPKQGFFVIYTLAEYTLGKENFTASHRQMKKLIHHIRKSFKLKRIERKESHFSRAQTSKILTVWFFFLLWYMMLVPPTPTTNAPAEQLVFQFHGVASERWVADAQQTHGAADRWGYLFDGTSTTQTFTWSTTTTTPTTSPTSSSTWTLATITNIHAEGKYAKIIHEIAIPNYYVAIETLVFSSDLAIYYLEHFLEGDRSKLFVTIDWYTPKNCVSPWGDTVTHGDFIIAYQQREDVSTICNVEKRFCNDGTLLGSYTQESCDEKTTYYYDKVIPISENEFVPSEYVQPSQPSNADGEFNSQGQLNAELDPTTRREDQPENAIIVNNAGIAQTVLTYKNCRTPRGEKVLNGQFVRAYKATQWYFNRPCEVEIRMCVDGHLKGDFRYKACAYTGASYEMVHGSN